MKVAGFLPGLIMFLFFPFSGLAQIEYAGAQTETMELYTDIVTVRAEDPSLLRLKVFVRVPYSELFYISTKDRKFLARAEIAVIVLDKKDFQVESFDRQDTLIVDSITETNDRDRYLSLDTAFNLEPGKYKIKCLLRDLETEQTVETISKVKLDPFNIKPIQISGVLIADSIEVTEEGLVKAHPHVDKPRTGYGTLFGHFFLYTNADYGKIKVKIAVRNERLKKVYQDERDFERQSESFPITFAIGDSSLSYGTYSLEIKAITGDFSVRHQTKFRIHWKSAPVTVADVELAIRQLRYVASGDELKKMRKLPAGERKKAFEAFWKRRDPSEETEKNELMEEYYRRIQFANSNFGFGKREGWKSDMGMVYVVLGIPSDVQRHGGLSRSIYLPTSNRPVFAYEIWHYFGEDNKFIFVDDTGFGEFRLYNRMKLHEVRQR